MFLKQLTKSVWIFCSILVFDSELMLAVMMADWCGECWTIWFSAGCGWRANIMVNDEGWIFYGLWILLL